MHTRHAPIHDTSIMVYITLPNTLTWVLQLEMGRHPISRLGLPHQMLPFCNPCQCTHTDHVSPCDPSTSFASPRPLGYPDLKTLRSPMVGPLGCPDRRQGSARCERPWSRPPEEMLSRNWQISNFDPVSDGKSRRVGVDAGRDSRPP
jgi:hypothetical protein